MAEELHLALLGHLEILRSGLPVTGFTSTKVQALLFYLAVTGRPHLRPALAGLLWGELPEASAHNNLRKALSILHRLVGPYLDIRRDSVAFNRTGAYWLDVEAFEDGVGCSTGKNGVEPLEKAVALYRDDFLAGFHVRDAPAFEEWALAERARLRMLALQALHTLAVHYSRLGDEGRAAAMGFTTRLLALEPWREEAHRQLMLLLAAGGQRSAALAQYETCRRMLMEELGVEPDHETTALFESIRDGTFVAPAAVAPPPPFVQVAEAGKEAEAAAAARFVFVGRGQELAQLGGFLDQALAGRGRVALVIGERGSGKTVLAQEFVRQAMDAHPGLLAVHGRCNAYTGIGDPYLPFLEIWQMLTGDVEAAWAGGAITGDHARRLWALMPDAVQALIDDGPELIDRFVPGAALLARVRTGAPRQATALSELLERRAASRFSPAMLQQTDLFAQYTKVLAAVSRQHPLILVVDDLQWADAGSIGLLFHLGRRLAGSRILLLGAYRPGEVAMGRPAAGSASERHPLEPVLLEFQRDLGDIYVDLAQADGRQFVDALLDTEPNRLDAAFREVLFRHTAGHPLFTVELLRGLQERGNLIQDDSGRWIEGPTLDWETLPPRVEAVIAERFGRLPEDWLSILTSASVEGEEFTAEAVAGVQALDEHQVVQWLSGPLSQQHRLVLGQGVERLGGRRLSRYRFRHFLFQKYLYGKLDPVRRADLHEAMGTALEALHGEAAIELAVPLARHFEAAGLAAKAADFLLQAGNRAARLFANEEAIAHYRRGIELVATLPDTPQHDRLEIALQLARERVHDLLGQRDAQRQCIAEMELLAAPGRGLRTAEQGELLLRLGHLRRDTAAYSDAWRHFEVALELARATGNRRLEARSLEGLGRVRYSQRGYVDAERLWRESLTGAQETGDEELQSVDARELGIVASLLGRPDEARNWAEWSRALCEENGDRHGLANALRSLGHLASRRGDWEEAERCYGDALALAEEIGDLRSYAASLRGLAHLAVSRYGALAEARAYLQRSMAIAEEIGARGLLLGNLHSLSSLACQEGAYDEAEAYQKQAIALCREFRDPVGVASAQARLAYVVVLQGHKDAGWAALLQDLQDSTAPGMAAQAVSSIVAVVGQIGVHLGRFQCAAELLGLGFGLDPTRSDNEAFAEPQLNVLRATLGAQELEAALARGATLDPAQVVADILACDTPEAFWSAGGDEMPPA